MQKIVKLQELRIQQHEDTIKQHEDSIKQREDTIKQRADTIKHRADTIKQHEDTIKQHEDTIKQREDTIKQREDTIKQREETIKQLGVVSGRQNESILRRDAIMQQNRVTISERNATLGQHEATIIGLYASRQGEVVAKGDDAGTSSNPSCIGSASTAALEAQVQGADAAHVLITKELLINKNKMYVLAAENEILRERNTDLEKKIQNGDYPDSDDG